MAVMTQPAFVTIPFRGDRILSTVSTRDRILCFAIATLVSPTRPRFCADLANCKSTWAYRAGSPFRKTLASSLALSDRDESLRSTNQESGLNQNTEVFMAAIMLITGSARRMCVNSCDSTARNFHSSHAFQLPGSRTNADLSPPAKGTCTASDSKTAGVFGPPTSLNTGCEILRLATFKCETVRTAHARRKRRNIATDA